MKELVLVRIDSKYCDYLRSFDEKVPYNFDKKKLRPFIGILFEVKGCTYFAPLSSPKAKHKNMKTTLDFFKIDNGKLGAINFNNMVPVTSQNVSIIDLNLKEVNKDEENYIKMLRKQLYWLNRNSTRFCEKAEKLYNKYIDGTLSRNIYNRCCNFKLLEEKCLLYNENVLLV